MHFVLRAFTFVLKDFAAADELLKKAVAGGLDIHSPAMLRSRFSCEAKRGNTNGAMELYEKL